MISAIRGWALIASLGLAACAQEPPPPPPPVIELGVIERPLPVDETLLVGRWDCREPARGESGRGLARASRDTVREFTADGGFRLFDRDHPAEQAPLARGEWSADGPRLVVTEIDLMGHDVPGSLRPATADVLILTNRVLLLRPAREREGPITTCRRGDA